MKDRLITALNRHIALLVCLSAILVGIGIAGFMGISGSSFVDALYMTVSTLTTVGMGEVSPLDAQGRLFTVALILLGVGFVAYTLTYFTKIFLDGNLADAYRRAQVEKLIGRLKDHYIICGYGQMGQIVARELLRSDVPVVVIEKEETAVARLKEKKVLYIDGDATEEENLVDAGIAKAKGVVTVVEKDSENLFIVLTARDLNKDLLIYSRSHAPGSDKKLLKAGATQVVSPYVTGGMRIVHNILRPTVLSFMEVALSEQGMDLDLAELAIPEGAAIVDKDLAHSNIRDKFNLIIIGIKRLNGEMIFNPLPTETLLLGDILIAMGHQDSLSQFTRWLTTGEE
jgi:voltage-gated potassium channel